MSRNQNKLELLFLGQSLAAQVATVVQFLHGAHATLAEGMAASDRHRHVQELRAKITLQRVVGFGFCFTI